MEAISHLPILIKNMHPKLHEGEFVFCSLQDAQNIDLREIVAMIKEEEGISIVVSKNFAERMALPYNFLAAWITLTVHSALEAVGLTAAFAKALADQQISCNVMAGYHHDHIFVPIEDAGKALAALRKLAEH